MNESRLVFLGLLVGVDFYQLYFNYFDIS
jgi:hypothetical protein